MSSSNKNIIKEAIEDAADLREAALEVVKQKVVKEMTPTLKNFIDKKINGSFKEDVDRLRRAKDGHGETEFEEGKKGEKDMDKDDKELDNESLAAMFPAISEVEDEEGEELGMAREMGYEGGMGMEDDPEVESAILMIPTLGEKEECPPGVVPAKSKGEDEEEEEMSEVYLDEEELKAAYESIMKTDKALSEDYDSSEWATEDPPPSDRGLAGKDKENEWEEEEPTGKKDHTSGIKESLEELRASKSDVGRYIRFLEGKLNETITVVKHLRNRIKEVNLLNQKVLKVNEMLNRYGKKMTKEHQRIVLSKIDKASSIREVKMVAETLEDTFGVIFKLNESTRKPKSNSQRRVTSGSPDQKVLRESVDKDDNEFDRWGVLAGLVE